MCVAKQDTGPAENALSPSAMRISCFYIYKIKMLGVSRYLPQKNISLTVLRVFLFSNWVVHIWKYIVNFVIIWGNLL
jgi:hypothetical protein